MTTVNDPFSSNTIANYHGDTSHHSIASGVCTKTSASGVYSLLTHKTSLATVEMEVTVTWVLQANPGFVHYIRVRCPNSATDTCYTLEINDTGSVITLYRFVTGGATTLAANNNAAGTLSSQTIPAILRATTVSGNVRLDGWVGGTQVFTNVVDSSGSKLTTGNNFGFSTYGDIAVDEVNGADYGAAAGSTLLVRRPARLIYR